MATATNPGKPDEAPRSDDSRDGEPHVPDEAGPHDVPDDEVIGKTLPAAPKPGDPTRPR